MNPPNTTHHNLILGYHGCDERVRNAVISGQSALIRSENVWDWLGHGYYFWEANYERALDFAHEQAARGLKPVIQTPSVVGAVLDLGLSLNLLETESLRMVRRAYEYLTQTFSEQGLTLPQNKGGKDRVLRNLDCAVLIALHKLRAQEGKPPCDSVRSAFIEGEPLYPNAGFQEKNHIQLCVLNIDCVKGYFLPIFGGVPPLPMT